MATQIPRNTTHSVRQRLLNHATSIKTDPNLVLIWYGLERFLYRLSMSSHCDRFVLKGAMLFRLWGGTDFRSTKDLDLLGFLRDEAEEVRDVFAAICEQLVDDDGLVFDASSVRVAEIRDAQEYGGFRVLLTAQLGTAVLPLQIDVGFGDAVTPAPTMTNFPSILNQPKPRIRVYPRETTIPRGSPVGLTAEFARDPAHTRQWAAFTARLGAGAFPPLSEAIDEIREFVLPPATAASANQLFMQHWKPNEHWQPVG